jgi:hypothetical protein
MENRKALQHVLDEGLSILKKNNFSSGVYNAWKNYANAVLEIITKEYPIVYLNFLRLQISVEQRYNDDNCQARISICLEYLIDMAKVIKRYC